LFARVLDLPGGMRIGTIHAFCQSLLRRFPVEAAISPHFTLVEDADARMALGEAVEAVVGAGGDAVALLAGQVMVGAFAALVGGLQAQMRRLRPVVERLAVDRAGVEAAMMRVLGVRSRDEESLRHAACVPPDEAHLRAVLRVVAEDGPPARARRTAVGMLDWLALPPDGRAARWDVARGAGDEGERAAQARGG
jgi:ATP-dependent helicase/nuclease subunit A